MSHLHRESGVGHVALVLVVLVFGAIGAIGYTLYANPQQPEEAVVTTQQNPAINVPDAPKIDKVSDLDQAVNVLDQVDPASSSAIDGSQLESQFQTF